MVAAIDCSITTNGADAAPGVPVSTLTTTAVKLWLPPASDGVLKVQPVPLTLAQLADRVKRAQGGVAETPVVISADRNVKYEAVVQVMDKLQKAGVQRVGLSVKQGS